LDNQTIARRVMPHISGMMHGSAVALAIFVCAMQASGAQANRVPMEEPVVIIQPAVLLPQAPNGGGYIMIRQAAGTKTSAGDRASGVAFRF
jgi:hypothetical protein